MAGERIAFTCPHCGKDTVYFALGDAPVALTRAERCLSLSIEQLHVGVRTYNCLKNSQIETVGELIRLTPTELLRRKNFGRRSLNELIEVLRELNLSLAPDPREELRQLNAMEAMQSAPQD